MTIIRRKLLGAVGLILGLILWGCMHPAAPVGTVVARAGSPIARGHVLKRGEAIQINDAIDVPARSNLKVQMADGTMISVAPESRLTIANYSAGTDGRHAKLALMQGLLRVLVPPATGPLTFEVSTPVGTASMRSASADWFITAEPDSVRVGVLTGTADLTDEATGQSVLIPSHWGTRMAAGHSPILPRVWTQMEFNAVIRLTECCQSKEDASPSRR